MHAIARAFVDHDAIAREPLAPDSIDPARVLQQLEACGRDLEGDTEPVDVVERSTNALVARFFVRRDGEVLRVRHELLDPRLGEAHVRPMFDVLYLHGLTRHHHRAAVSTIVLDPKDGVGATLEYAYPPAKAAR
ncbi:MAG: hypothetical protein J0L92_32060 [Deltaproteobacteria bacterium]|nr:hypothetical protein [Deltaproteobacteria bacterium]